MAPHEPPTITMDADKTVTATFTALPTYTLTPTAGTGGTITPNTVQTVLQGGSTTFAMVPTAGYHIVDVSVDGVSQGIVSSYTFTNVTSNHAISARFEQEKKQTVIVLQIGNSMFTVNGGSIALDSPPVIKNGRTLVPIRAIIEALRRNRRLGWYLQEGNGDPWKRDHRTLDRQECCQGEWHEYSYRFYKRQGGP